MHDVFFQNLLKAIVAIDPISLIPVFTTITANLSIKKVIKLAATVFLITSILFNPKKWPNLIYQKKP